MNVITHKKLIEVALPLEAINIASAREKSIRHGHPSTLHLWWARRPLAAARAVIFSQMVDDPSAHPDLFPTPAKQEKERQRLFRIIEELVKWENTTNEIVLQAARDEIWASWRSACAENADHPQVKELFNRHILPAFHDPFAGGGALPLEAQRLGLEAYASDLNPVAVLINKAMIEIPPKFAGKPPINPESRQNKELFQKVWAGAQGLAEDIHYYGKWMRDEAEKRIGYLYPKVEITEEMARDRSDLKSLIGQKLTVIAWIWARTVKSPDPAFAKIDVPLVSTFMLAKKTDKQAYVEPIFDGKNYRFIVKIGEPKNKEAVENGTKLARANFRCLMSGAPISGDYIKTEGNAGRMNKRLMAIVAEGERGRVYLSPIPEIEAIENKSVPIWKPEIEICGTTQYLGMKPYGMSKFSDIFTSRQLVALTAFSDLVQEAHELVKRDALSNGFKNEGSSFNTGGTGAVAYADAVTLYLAFAVDRMAMSGNSLVRWNSVGEKAQHCFGRQALPMVWDFGEPNFLAKATGSIDAAVFYSSDPLNWLNLKTTGISKQEDASTQQTSQGKIVSTDPPYYDNVPYADLSDFFYVWLRRSLKPIFPSLFTTLAVPKTEELVAFAYRHKNKDVAKVFFLDGMTRAMHCLSKQAHPAFPVTIYYAFKQSETESDGTASTGWETFLESVIQAGFSITGTWPIRTEMKTRQRAMDTNALASSIVLVCRSRSINALTITRREFISKLKSELPSALAYLQRGNIAPVDLEQAAIGPGMAIYTSYEKVIDAEGNSLSVRDALRLINQTLYEVLTEQEGDFDSDTRWALVWFEQFGFSEGDYGVAEQLSKSKGTSVEGMVSAGILNSKSGKVRLFKPSELPADWEPEKDRRLTVWEMTHQLIRSLEAGGENPAAELVVKIGSKSEIARELAYRLYTVCERKKRSTEAGYYNGLVLSWPEILRLAQEQAKVQPRQGQMI